MAHDDRRSLDGRTSREIPCGKDDGRPPSVPAYGIHGTGPMRPIATLVRTFLLLVASAPALVTAQQPITLSDVEEGLPEIRADEPKVGHFSAEQAAKYLDRSALNWQKTKKCATCHTNLFYMAARPALAAVLPDSGEVRRFYEDYRRVRWQRKGPTEAQGFWPIVVGTGLTLNDAQTTGKLSDVAREVLDMHVDRATRGRWLELAPLRVRPAGDRRSLRRHARRARPSASPPTATPRPRRLARASKSCAPT